jgi:hypothetical protein
LLTGLTALSLFANVSNRDNPSSKGAYPKVDNEKRSERITASEGVFEQLCITRRKMRPDEFSMFIGHEFTEIENTEKQNVTREDSV